MKCVSVTLMTMTSCLEHLVFLAQISTLTAPLALNNSFSALSQHSSHAHYFNLATLTEAAGCEGAG